MLLERVPIKFYALPHNIYESTILLHQLRQLTSGELEVAREAGTLHLQVSSQDGTEGIFNFVPNTTFQEALRSTGIADVTDRNGLALAVYDVSASYVMELNELGVQLKSSDQLIGMAVQHVSLEFVHEFWRLGYTRLSPDELTGMRVQGVTPD